MFKNTNSFESEDELEQKKNRKMLKKKIFSPSMLLQYSSSSDDDAEYDIEEYPNPHNSKITMEQEKQAMPRKEARTPSLEEMAPISLEDITPRREEMTPTINKRIENIAGILESNTMSMNAKVLSVLVRVMDTLQILNAKVDKVAADIHSLTCNRVAQAQENINAEVVLFNLPCASAENINDLEERLFDEASQISLVSIYYNEMTESFNT